MKLILILFLISCQSNTDSIDSKIDMHIKKYLDLGIFSGTVMVKIDGKVEYLKSFGFADRELKIKNTNSTRYNIGSISKAFTKLIILQLIKENKLNFDDKLGQFYKGFHPFASEKVTVSHLLNHKSGIGDYLSDPSLQYKDTEEDMNVLIQDIKKLPLFFEPGTEMEYSNSGYILLGGIIEKVTNDSYMNQVKKRILLPLHMDNTFPVKAEFENRAIGYIMNINGEIVDNKPYVPSTKPDGGYYSTVNDIVQFFDSYLNDNTLIPKNIRNKDEGFSMISLMVKPNSAIPFAGGFPGSNTALFQDSFDKISIVVFSNMDEPVAEKVGFDIFSILNEKQVEDPQLPAVINVYQNYKSNGIDFVKNNFEKLTTNFHPTDPKDLILNQLGYDLLRSMNNKEAIDLFTLNTELFAENPNVWDSLGEAYYKSGDLKKALINYQKAISLDPELESSMDMIQKIKSEMK